MKPYATYNTSTEIMLLRVRRLRCHSAPIVVYACQLLQNIQLCSVCLNISQLFGLIRTTCIIPDTCSKCRQQQIEIKTGTHFTHVNFKYRENPCTPTTKVRWEVFHCRTRLTFKKGIRFKSVCTLNSKCLFLMQCNLKC